MAQPTGESDRQLVSRTLGGDERAFEALVRRHYRAAYSVAFSLTNSAMDAEDVCQDAFVRALEKLEGCRDPDRFQAWFLRIVRNRAHNFREYQGLRAGEGLEDVSTATSGSTSDRAEQNELSSLLQLALQGLSPVQRQVVLLHDLEGWKHRDIARDLKISEGMSRQHLFNARKILREYLATSPVKEYRDV